MANRRKTPKSNRKKASRPRVKEVRLLSGAVAPPREAVAVVLVCVGILTLLSLGSFDPDDVSLNASGSLTVQNWIGPAGAYWADILLQVLGIGAFALGAGLILAGWRALIGKRVAPGWREGGGTLLFIISFGTFCHLLMGQEPNPYPAGGVGGALVGQVLFEHFADVGAYIISGSMVMVSLALTADGVLTGLGHKGLGALRSSFAHLQAGLVMLREKRNRFGERRLELAEARTERQEQKEEAKKEAEELNEHWTLGELVRREEEEAAREEAKNNLFKKARALGKAWGDSRADKVEARERNQKLEEEALDKGDLTSDFTAVPPPKLDDEEGFTLGAVDEIVDAAESSAPVVHRFAAPAESPAALSEEPGAGEEEDVLIQAAYPSFNPLGNEPEQLVLLSGEEESPAIVDVRPEVDGDEIERVAEQTTGEVVETSVEPFQLPPATLLGFESAEREEIDETTLQDNAFKLTTTLKDYKIEGYVREIRPGPVVTMYEYRPAAGTKVSKIAGLSDDLAMSMEALRVRIVAPIPGKGAVGIEIPNLSREIVYFKEVIAHESFRSSNKRLPMVLGKDIEGNGYVADWARMPHLLVAGATGSGKSVFVNAVIMSILFKKTPDEVRFIMIDPKMLELSVYDGIPHLLLPVVTDPKKATLALRWAVDEMERRYQLLSDLGVRHIDGYNAKVSAANERGEILRRPSGDEDLRGEDCEKLPYIVIIVDELADLMMTASNDVESSIMRLALKARAAGVHLMLATQRPSVDVLTGVIKANFPTRVAFQVAARADSRTILDSIGAENLLGNGDMLYQTAGGNLTRVHGAYVTEDEIDSVVSFLKAQGEPTYREEILEEPEEIPDFEAEEEPRDDMYDSAVALVSESQTASISMIQRRLRVGYNRAARMIERMEVDGIVGPPDGSKGREVYSHPTVP